LVNSSGTDAGRQYYIVINYNDGTKDYTYTSDAVASSGLTSTSLGSVSFTINDTVSTVAGTKNAWVAVPEPTSGLLALVGFAALALRRRRA
ncbi:MAG: PEP-CTERM sorting domain-containing protein, partial [Eubacteriales bacterium]|nr:PEP-CTERM sorting domain-containing protein [Eubacteriales bacterium]